MNGGECSLVDLVFSELVLAEDGSSMLSKAAEARIEVALRDLGDAEDTSAEVVELFHLAQFLEEEGSASAAESILRVLLSAKDDLAFFRDGESACDDANDRALEHVTKRAPRLGEAKPNGALKAGDLARQMSIPLSS